MFYIGELYCLIGQFFMWVSCGKLVCFVAEGNILIRSILVGKEVIFSEWSLCYCNSAWVELFLVIVGFGFNAFSL